MCDTVKDLTDTKGSVLKALSTAVGNMQYGNTTFFAELVAKACCKTLGFVNSLFYLLSLALFSKLWSCQKIPLILMLITFELLKY